MSPKKLLATLALLPTLAFGQPTSPFNHTTVVVDSTTSDYEFLISGHFYGGSQNKSGFPASTLLGNIDAINQSNAKFFICLGDMVMDVKNDIPKFKSSLFSMLQVPLFNAVGNHDISGTIYQDNFGKTWSAFDYQGDRFVLLDAEEGDSQIKGEQLEFFKKQIAGEYNNLFIFSHRPIWAEARTDLEGVFPDNTQGAFGTNYLEIEPLLQSTNKPVYWFSGSLGDAPVSYFYHRPEQGNLHLIQTAIRDLERDAILKVKLKAGKVSFETQSLTGQTLEPIEHYNLEFWRSYRKPVEFNYRLIPLWTKNALTHRYFWYGVGSVLFLLVAVAN